MLALNFLFKETYSWIKIIFSEIYITFKRKINRISLQENSIKLIEKLALMKKF